MAVVVANAAPDFFDDPYEPFDEADFDVAPIVKRSADPEPQYFGFGRRFGRGYRRGRGRFFGRSRYFGRRRFY